MNEVVLRIVASVVTACLFCLSSLKLMGALQQSGYQNGGFWRWLKRKDNLYFNRLAVLALCLALCSAIVSLCFSFLGLRAALLISSVPFLALLLIFWRVDGKYALKIPVKRTGRLQRLFAVYFLFTACAAYLFAAVLGFLAEWNGSFLYGLIAYVPFAILPMLLPLLLCAANAVEGVFEKARNAKFVKRAGQVLNEREMIRVGIVGSYGKTSVKNILKTLLLEKYSVVETPESYNTPIGIAKTVFSPQFDGKQVLIAEMGARKSGDIAELCALVKPDYALFTGVCEQHIQSFGSMENVWKEKSEILKCGAKKVVCGEGIRVFAEKEFSDNGAIVYANSGKVKNLRLETKRTSFTLLLGEKEIEVETRLLGSAAAENILSAALLACEMGLTVEEIERGLKNVEPIAHRLQLLENGGAYILDDGYNCNPKGAEEALAALGRFEGRKCIVTPGIVECGILEEKLNGELGGKIAEANLDRVILVGETLVGAVKTGYLTAGGNAENLKVVKTLALAQEELSKWVHAGDAVLFLNDLPDVY